MHSLGREGVLRGTDEQLCRLARCSPAEIVLALTDLQTTGAADVTERNGVYTVINRRMFREHKERKMSALRQKRFRHNATNNDCVTPKFAGDDISQKSEIRDQKRLNDAENGILNRSPINRFKERELMSRLRNALGEDEMQRCGGMWRAHHVRKHPDLLDRALSEVERMIKVGEAFSESPAACLTDILSRWGPQQIH